MVKLIRITSQDNCNFKASLAAGISIEKDAGIAVQSLTFDSQFNALSINSSNNEIMMNLDTNLGFATISDLLKTKNYSSSTYKEFLTDLQGTLNGCLAVDETDPSLGDVYGGFDVSQVGDEILTTFKYSPLQMMFNLNDTLAPRGFSGITRSQLFGISKNSGQPAPATLDVVTTDANSYNLGNTSVEGWGGNTDTLKNFIFPLNNVATWSRGSASFLVDVRNLVDHAGADNEHGFAIGLSFTNIMTEISEFDGVIPESARDFELIIEKTTSSYQFLTPNSAGIPETPNPVVPTHLVNITTHPDWQTHDVMLFERKQNVITGKVLTTSAPGGTTRTLFSYVLSDADRHKPIYPYMYIKSQNTTIGRPVITMNGILKNDEGFGGLPFYNLENEVTGQLQGIGGLNANNAYQQMGTNFAGVLPILNDNRFDYIANEAANQNIRLIINGDILQFLGFNRNTYPIQKYHNIDKPLTLIQDFGDFSESPYTNIVSFILQPGDFQLTNSDSYVVVIDSANVFSYDASKTNYTGIETINMANTGRRYNILAVIPKNDNTGILEFEPNELTYIDIDNAQSQILKNLNIRVLDKNLQPITTNGKSIITLLIKDK